MRNTPIQQIAKDAINKHPDMPSRRLARLVYENNKAQFNNWQHAYSAIRYYRGNHGVKNRKKIDKGHGCTRPNQGEGFTWKLPESKAKPWEPFILETRRCAIMSDIHIPFHDKKAIEQFVKVAKKRNPDTILLNGDICDFFSISRFEKNASLSSVRDEVGMTRHFLGWLREQFPKAAIIFKEGNHDEWLQKYIFRKAPELYGLPEIELQNLLTAQRESEPAIGGIQWVGEQRLIKAGHLNILHGHELGKGSIAPPVNPARGAFVKALGIVLVGHLHRTSSHSERTINNELIACWSSGCFAGLWPDYAKVNKWDHSGVMLELHKDDFSLDQIRLHNGKLLTK